MPTGPRLLIFGLGYCGAAVADAARGAGFVVTGTVRHAPAAGTVVFDAAAACIAESTHVLSTVPPGTRQAGMLPDAQESAPGRAHGDPVLALYADAIADAPHLRWIGYLSSTVVYGDRDGGWVDEDAPPAPCQERGQRRLEAEIAWGAFAGQRAVDVFRLAGIYGPGRSAFDDLRSGRARRVVKPGHAFGRIHRDDIACAVLAAMQQNRTAGRRVLNLADDVPAESAAVIEEAAHLLGMPVPPAVAFADMAPAMSPMAQSFWAENRKVASRKTQSMLGLTWRYPSYPEGLRAILREEAAHRSA
jgi:nucleoside-diphosphate-sugar epimerase